MENMSDLAKKLLEELDESVVENLDEEELLKLRKELNPYGTTIEGSNNFLNLSYTNLREEYIKKFMVTALVGFLNRMCDEWRVPDNVLVTPVYEYVKNPKILDKAITEKMSDSLKKEHESNKKWMEKRIIVKQFIEEMFQYDPDIHVRSSYKPNYKDITRKKLYTPAVEIAMWGYKKDGDDTKDEKVKKELLELHKEFKEEYKEAKENKEYEKQKEKLKLKQTDKKVNNKKEKDEMLESNVTNFIPPRDIYEKFRVYYESNYETLRECVKDLYGVRPDFEFALNPLSWHETEEDAEKYKRKHAKEVITDVVTLTSSKWNLIGPFKECRENVKFYNEHTTIIEEMFKHLENDAKLGSELLKKKVKVKKVKNILEHGPDPDGLETYKKNFGTLSTLGKINPEKEMYKYRVLKEPDNAVEVPVFRISEGGQKIEKDFFYTEEGLPDSIVKKK